MYSLSGAVNSLDGVHAGSAVTSRQSDPVETMRHMQSILLIRMLAFKPLPSFSPSPVSKEHRPRHLGADRLVLQHLMSAHRFRHIQGAALGSTKVRSARLYGLDTSPKRNGLQALLRSASAMMPKSARPSDTARFIAEPTRSPTSSLIYEYRRTKRAIPSMYCKQWDGRPRP